MPRTAPAPVRVERVPIDRTYPLRARVLRPGAPVSRVHLAIDGHPDTAAFAALDRVGTVVGTAVLFPEACPWRADEPGAWRLRGMATDPARRSTGIGRAVLAAAVSHARDAGGTLVWCHARVPARRFYERAGFRVHGDEWLDPEIGPHVAMWRPLDIAG